MKVFISSLITGYEPLRDAAATAIAALGHEVVRAEDFPAFGGSPQSACLAGVRASDVVILILGDRYGYAQAAGLSATHEEYREARDSKTVLVFVQQGVSPELQQAELIREVQSWEQGHFTAPFTGADELRDRVTRALHDFSLANEAAPLNETELARTRSATDTSSLPVEPSIAVGGHRPRPDQSCAATGGTRVSRAAPVRSGGGPDR